MTWNFLIEYKSGRIETMSDVANKKGLEIKKDLHKAKEVGSVVKFTAKQTKTPEQSKKTALTFYAEKEQRDKIIAAAAKAGQSVSEYLRDVNK